MAGLVAAAGGQGDCVCGTRTGRAAEACCRAGGWKRKRQEGCIKAAAALNEARARKERAMQGAADAMRARFEQIQRAEDNFHRSVSAISLGRSKPSDCPSPPGR